MGSTDTGTTKTQGNTNQEDSEETQTTTPTRASLTSATRETRLSRISCNTKFAVTLNQIERIEINSTHDRDEDGVTIYMLEVYLRCVQSGIPTGRPLKERKHKYKEPQDYGFDHDTADDDDLDPIVKQRSREKNPHYRLMYRFSDFYRLRQELRDAVEKGATSMHTKWCSYCCRMYWLLNETMFPGRSMMDPIVTRQLWLKKWRARRRRRKLTYFLDQIVHGSRSLQYRFNCEQYDGFVNTSYILKEFLSEPHMRQAGTGW